MTLRPGIEHFWCGYLGQQEAAIAAVSIVLIIPSVVSRSHSDFCAGNVIAFTFLPSWTLTIYEFLRLGEV